MPTKPRLKHMGMDIFRWPHSAALSPVHTAPDPKTEEVITKCSVTNTQALCREGVSNHNAGILQKMLGSERKVSPLLLNAESDRLQSPFAGNADVLLREKEKKQFSTTTSVFFGSSFCFYSNHTRFSVLYVRLIQGMSPFQCFVHMIP